MQLSVGGRVFRRAYAGARTGCFGARVLHRPRRERPTPSTTSQPIKPAALPYSQDTEESRRVETIAGGTQRPMQKEKSPAKAGQKQGQGAARKEVRVARFRSIVELADWFQADPSGRGSGNSGAIRCSFFRPGYPRPVLSHLEPMFPVERIRGAFGKPAAILGILSEVVCFCCHGMALSVPFGDGP